MRYVVELPRIAPVAPDACVVCGKRDAPRHWPFDPPTMWTGLRTDSEDLLPAVNLRMCFVCGGRIDRRRITEISLAAGAGVIAGAASWILWPPNNVLAWERLAIARVGVPFAAFVVLRWFVFRGPITRLARVDRIDYRFTNREFAAEFARVNHTKVRA